MQRANVEPAVAGRSGAPDTVAAVGDALRRGVQGTMMGGDPRTASVGEGQGSAQLTALRAKVQRQVDAVSGLREKFPLGSRAHHARTGLTAFREKHGITGLPGLKDRAAVHRDVPPTTLAEEADTVVAALNREFVVYRQPSWVWNWFGVVAGILSFAAVIPQLSQIVERQSACDINMQFIVGNIAVQVLWLIFGLGNRLWLSATFSAVFIAVMTYMLSLKLQYDTPEKCERERLVAHEVEWLRVHPCAENKEGAAPTAE